MTYFADNSRGDYFRLYVAFLQALKNGDRKQAAVFSESIVRLKANSDVEKAILNSMAGVLSALFAGRKLVLRICETRDPNKAYVDYVLNESDEAVNLRLPINIRWKLTGTAYFTVVAALEGFFPEGTSVKQG